MLLYAMLECELAQQLGTDVLPGIAIDFIRGIRNGSLRLDYVVLRC